MFGSTSTPQRDIRIWAYMANLALSQAPSITARSPLSYSATPSDTEEEDEVTAGPSNATSSSNASSSSSSNPDSGSLLRRAISYANLPVISSPENRAAASASSRHQVVPNEPKRPNKKHRHSPEEPSLWRDCLHRESVRAVFEFGIVLEPEEEQRIADAYKKRMRSKGRNAETTWEA